MSSNYQAIISDIDGTLTPIDPNGIPSKKVRRAISEASLAGKHVCLASGRPYSMVEHLIELLDLTSPVITDNGALITDPVTKKILRQATIDKTITSEVLAIAATKPLYRVSTNLGPFEKTIILPKQADIMKVSIHDLPINEADEIVELLTNRFSSLSVIRAASYQGNDHLDVYISHAKATKQHAVFELSKIIGISPQNMIGIGDGYNDFPLLEACGLKVAMGNAVPELKAIADVIAPSVEDDGLAMIINQYLLN